MTLRPSGQRQAGGRPGWCVLSPAGCGLREEPPVWSLSLTQRVALSKSRPVRVLSFPFRKPGGVAQVLGGPSPLLYRSTLPPTPFGPRPVPGALLPQAGGRPVVPLSPRGAPCHGVGERPHRHRCLRWEAQKLVHSAQRRAGASPLPTRRQAGWPTEQ